MSLLQTVVQKLRTMLVWQQNASGSRATVRNTASIPSSTPPTVPPRSAYKTVWNGLSGTEEQARFSVGGFVDEEAHVFTGEASRTVLESTVGIGANDDVLEIGCGVARVGYALAPHCRSWTGCDVAGNMLTHAAGRLTSFTNVQLIEISGFDLAPIADESVDVVYCTVVFMHLDEWDRYNYLREACRVLRPGGRVYVDNFTLGTDAGWAVFKDGLAYPPDARPPQISKSSTPLEIRVFLERAGFERIVVEEEDTWVRGWARKPAVDGSS